MISDDSESDSEEDIPARVSPAKSAKSNSLSSRPPLARTTAEPEQPEDEETDEDETQSQNSSTRDSRSPVVFSQHAQTSELVQAQRSASPESESTSSDSGSEAEEEDDEPIQKSNAKDVEMKDDEDDEEEEEGSENSESESEDEGTEVQVPKSSPPILPEVRPAKVSAPKTSRANNSKTSITEEDMSTQDEIDQQLTSSMYEVHSSGAAAVPSSSSIRPPLKVGASLMSLNSGKPLYASSAPKSSTAGRRSQPSRINMDEASASESESESEEESDDDTTSSSDEDHKSMKSKAGVTTAGRKSRSAASESDDDSDDSSSEDSSSDSEDSEEVRARNELAAQIAGYMANGDSQVSLPSPKAYRSGTQDVKKDEKGKREKKVDKYLVGQKFSMPV